ncbi:hypothetical protein R1sor_000897 [Riccia sorocarpa]|uniref:BTB domain-containing protein n=1 Tax=Riccia sorocarpa TaxID=122646 RepID=A0ABD3GUF0_9MARC
MECPSCNDRIYCDCSTTFPGDPVFKAPGCDKCRCTQQEKLLELETELNDIQIDLIAKIAQHEAARDMLELKLSFLKLPDADASSHLPVVKGDVKLVVNGLETIHAHRFILAAKSKVFYRMFECGMLENKTGVVPIDDASYPVMKAVVKHCYTAEINFTDEVLPEEVLKVAHKYQIPHLRDTCAIELCARMNERNLLDMLRFSKMYDVNLLRVAAAKYFRMHFDPVFSALFESL